MTCSPRRELQGPRKNGRYKRVYRDILTTNAWDTIPDEGSGHVRGEETKLRSYPTPGPFLGPRPRPHPLDTTPD